MTEESKQLTPQQSFEENIKDRLRKDVGSLIPNEVLSQLVEKSMKEMFFTRKMEQEHSGYSARMIEKPSWFDAQVKELVSEKITSYITTWLKENEAAIEGALVEDITKNAPKLLAKIFIDIIAQKANNTSNDAINNLISSLRSRGMSV